MAPRLLLIAALFAAGCTCQSDSDCPFDEVCVDGSCVQRSGGGTGHLTLSPATASVPTRAGDPTPSARFAVGNDGSAALSFDVACNQGAPSPAGGVVAIGSTTAVSLALPAYPTAGARTARCTVSTTNADGGPLAFTASIEVGPDATAPAAALAAPAAGSMLSGTVTLAADASDAVGVVSVDFAVDGAIVASAAGAPYSVSWCTASVWNGPHTLAAIARDAAGNAGTSAGVAVFVGNYPGAALSVHTSMGLPDAATADPANRDHFLSVKHQYVLSYSGTRRTPNWASWELNTAWLGAVARQDDFRADDTFPAGFPQAQLSDYFNSGWDRGHLCPSEDRTATLLDNQNTFYLTNMVPQADNVNGGPWAQLEAYARSLATSGKEIFEIAGGIYAGTAKTIGADAVAVPSSTFKVVVVLDAPGQGAANVTASTRVISVIMPNDNAQVAKSADWHGFRVKALDIEAQTGLRLLSDVSEPVREALESQIDTAP